MSIYRVSCGHPACGAWSVQVEIDQELVCWEPPSVSGLVDIDGNEIITPWAGVPIDEAYAQHYAEVHAPQKQPPLCVWKAVA